MKQVLIADKSKENILKAMLLLEKNCVIFPARTSTWMMKVLKQKKIDLIVINVNIDDKYETAKLIAKIRKSEKYRKIPFIITTTDSRTELETAKECMEYGNCETLVLPYANEELKEAVLRSNG